MSCMMIEFWWKVAVLSVVTTVVVTLAGLPVGILMAFAVSFIGWTVLLLLFLCLWDWWVQWRYGRSVKK